MHNELRALRAARGSGGDEIRRFHRFAQILWGVGGFGVVL